MKRSDADEWRKAAQEEIDAHSTNGTWSPCPLPPGKKTIGSRWVFAQKFLSDGALERYKARLVAKGYSQRPGYDYLETFAPTVRMASIRVVLALSALEDLDLRSVDISHAYINGDLEEEIYMDQPEGFHFGNPGDVLRLRKSLYGLKQAGRVWNRTLHSTLGKLGFSRLQSDASLYLYRRGPVRIIMPIFIDDITIASTDAAESDRVVQELGNHFKLRDLGPTSFLLGIEITRDRSNRRIMLSQRQYVLDMLERFGMASCAPVATPMGPKVRLTTSDAPSSAEDKATMSAIPYLSAVGSLMYLCTCTRPDIAYAVCLLARFSSNPGWSHWLAVKHLFRYLKGTLDMRLVYGPSASKELFLTYSDSDYAGDTDTLRSTGAYIVKIGSGAVDWSSKLQTVVAQSTTEAEYLAAVNAGRNIAWMRNLLSELGYNLSSSPSTLFMDNNSTIAVAKNPEHCERLKHIQLRLYWLRDVIQDGLIAPVYVPTAHMLADLLTKPLAPVRVEQLRRLLGLE